jgi:hypothetical protein
MTRFAIEHLPRAAATYHVTPLDYGQAQAWLSASDFTSLIRTTELIGAIGAGFGCSLQQSDKSLTLSEGDEALLISLSFSVMLAWAEGGIAPVTEDWRCLLLQVDQPQRNVSTVSMARSLPIRSEPAQIG